MSQQQKAPPSETIKKALKRAIAVKVQAERLDERLYRLFKLTDEEINNVFNRLA